MHSSSLAAGDRMAEVCNQASDRHDGGKDIEEGRQLGSALTREWHRVVLQESPHRLGQRVKQQGLCPHGVVLLQQQPRCNQGVNEIQVRDIQELESKERDGEPRDQPGLRFSSLAKIENSLSS